MATSAESWPSSTPREELKHPRAQQASSCDHRPLRHGQGVSGVVARCKAPAPEGKPSEEKTGVVFLVKDQACLRRRSMRFAAPALAVAVYPDPTVLRGVDIALLVEAGAGAFYGGGTL